MPTLTAVKEGATVADMAQGKDGKAKIEESKKDPADKAQGISTGNSSNHN